ncbi:hypothetical protein A7D16_07455 [Xanthomonas nasturtii]|nr:hypothetical protein A7D16_07455 [Xanthomonas nasturtii]
MEFSHMEQQHFKEPAASAEIRRIYESGRLLPFFGSGFTKDEKARKGRVPSAASMTKHITTMASERCKDPQIAQQMRNITDLKVAFNLLFKNEYIDSASARTYLSNTFSDVKLNGAYKSDLLKLTWPHIFTFNIDDAIEPVASKYKKLLPNKEVAKEYISSNRCLFKIHGDVEELCAYTTGNTVFTWAQYVNSIDTNYSMLSFIQEQAIDSSFIFIGCSLDNELDLMSLAQKVPFSKSIFLKKGKVDFEEGLKLSSYGIDRVIYFDQYDEIPRWLVSVLKDAKIVTPERELTVEDMPDITAAEAMHLIANGGPLMKSDELSRIALCPAIFPRRQEVDSITKSIRSSQLLLVVGRRFSGKTTLLLQTIEAIHDYSTSFFSTSDSFSPEILSILASRRNHAFFFDSNFLDSQALDAILSAKTDPSNKIILCASQGDADLFRFRIGSRSIQFVEIAIPNKLTEDETENFNKSLNSLGLANYSTKNNLLNFAYHYFSNYKSQLPPNALFERAYNSDELKVLILIAAFGKAERILIKAILPNFAINEFILSNDRLLEHISSKSNSSIGAVICNSTSWLVRVVKDEFKRDRISAIIAEIIVALAKDGFRTTANNLISFDKLNELAGGSVNTFIREVYELIQQPFEEDGHYWIQRAKSQLISGRSETDFLDGKQWAGKVRAENSDVKNTTYYSATFVRAQLHARSYRISSSINDLRSFFEDMYESTRNYSNNKVHIDRMLRSVKPDIAHAVSALGATNDPFFLPRKNEVAELVGLFNTSQASRRRP